MEGDDITLSSVSLQSKALSVTAAGDANLAEDSANLSYSIAANDLGPFADAYDVNANGAIKASGAVTGALSAPTLRGEAAFTGLEFDDEPLGKVEITHKATFGETPSGDLKLAADGSRFGPVTFDGGFLLGGEALELTDMTATGLGAKVDGDIALNLSSTLATGDIAIDASDLSQLSKVAGQDVSGGIIGQIKTILWRCKTERRTGCCAERSKN